MTEFSMLTNAYLLDCYMGTVIRVDDMGDLIMKWDNGCGLNVIIGVDKVIKLN